MEIIVGQYFSEERARINMAEPRAATILNILQGSVALPNLVKPKNDPFEILVITIISQNTADTNTERAFESLSKQIKITPKALANANTNTIEACLHVGGLYKSKARSIQMVSKIILEKYNSSLASVLSSPLDKARKTLMELPGVGPKTADVVLLFSANQATIPIDTHVNRVSKRLGLTPANGDYETTRLSLQSLFNTKDYLAVHLLLIALGRKYCKANNPCCYECPVHSYCPSNDLGVKHV